ncbi:MAG: class I SAM-dependent DNA methyltransferase [Ardenticatenaceae bacterium]|nr:class I SAM-dependent DNA methyltransferase [Ardenticatenaceae bacterium]
MLTITSAQNADMDFVGGNLLKYGVLDYVCAWYIKAAQFIQNTNIQVAFVSTNSITQGEQVGVLWQWLLAQNIKIHFAHRTFRWSNDARGKAAVFCVIIGFGLEDAKTKRLYEYTSPDAEPLEVTANNINPYLVDATNVIITSRNKPICAVPQMVKGSQPTDDGNLLLTDEEKATLLGHEPHAQNFIYPLVSAHQFLNGENRWCLWLKDISPKELRALPNIMKRVENVRTFRLASKKAATVKLAAIPSLFAEIRQPESNYVLVPRHSSENRRFIPMAFFSKEYIVSDSCAAVPNATLYHFGVLQSTMHMAWTRQVCGRIKGDFRYSNNIVYNNYPWPENPSESQRQRVETAAQKVLDARTHFPNDTLADLYDPNTMPKLLVDAHRELDAAVDACYRSRAFKTELERLEFLFDLYKRYTAPLIQAVEAATKKPRKVRK